MSPLLRLLVSYLLLINALSFGLMCLDKRQAQKHRRRISEATLLWTAALGGSVGCLLAMRLVRHKTLHRRFSVGVPLLLLLQLAAAVALWRLAASGSFVQF